MLSGAQFNHIVPLGVEPFDNAPRLLNRFEEGVRTVTSSQRDGAGSIGDVKKPVHIFNLADIFDQHDSTQTIARHTDSPPVPSAGMVGGKLCGVNENSWLIT